MGVWVRHQDKARFYMDEPTTVPYIQYTSNDENDMEQWTEDAMKTCAKFRKVVAKFICKIESDEKATRGQLDFALCLKALT